MEAGLDRALDMPNDPRFRYRRRRIGDAANDPLGVNPLEQDTARIDSPHHPARELTTESLEVPPRDTVLKGHDNGVGTEERVQIVNDWLDLMRFEREEHDIVRTKVANGVGRRKRSHRDLIVSLDQRQAMLANGSEMRPAGNHRDVVPGAGQTDPHVTANGAGPNHTDLHVTVLTLQTA